MRKSAIFNLEVTKGGLQIKEADPPVPPEKEGPVGAAMGDRRGRMLGRKSTMAGIAEALALFLTRPVTDGTGLKGYYDFDIKWTASSTAEPSPPFDGFGSEGEALIAANEGNRSGRTLDRRPRRTSLLQLTQYSYPIEAVPNPRICGQL
jgi:uncharacterized protein (TIGR03435 family)